MLNKQYYTTDNTIRVALKKYIYNNVGVHSSILVAEELSILHGSTIVDLITIDDLLHGYEIKSDCDNFDRLSMQICDYNKIFDKLTLVVGYKHIYKALEILPDWWGICVAENDMNDKVNIYEIKKPSQNPEIDILGLIKLLWRDEASLLYSQLTNTTTNNSISRSRLYKSLFDISNEKQLKEKIIYFLKNRLMTKADSLQKQYDGSCPL